LILGAMRELNIHATAEQVYAAVAARHPSISKATVYRNLSQMAESGEIMHIGSFDGSAHYDHVCGKHYHFICESCKRIFDVHEHFPDLCDRITVIMEDFEIKGHSLNFSGLCPECKSK